MTEEPNLEVRAQQTAEHKQAAEQNARTEFMNRRKAQFAQGYSDGIAAKLPQEFTRTYLEGYEDGRRKSNGAICIYKFPDTSCEY